jgi:DNA gyrase subunit A
MDERTDGRIVDIHLEDEMKRSYISYAMSVIVARALPDARDGLKPVHRRILFAMNELNLEPNKPYKKCARIVGDTMGKYHPHGDSSIYDALVRMAQDFSMRYPLVDGHGNFGSMDGDAPAAQRYTEARMTRLSVEMIADIDKDTVDFTPNYDGEFMEPSVFPAAAPNLLINGSNGIAVGMATNIPPHNISEAIDALLRIIDDKAEGIETECADLLPYVKGPDFPTGGDILGTRGIKQAYLTGRGKVTIRARAEIEEMTGGRQRIRVTEIPYQANKAVLLKKISDLVHEKKIDGVSDLRDESDRNGISVIIELSRGANAGVVLNNLYQNTQLQDTFGVIMLALVDGEPKILNLKELLSQFLKHRENVVTRRTVFDLKKAEKRAHIVEGFLKALDHIDEIIAIIRSNRDVGVSKSVMMERFGFTQPQADAIVEMRLRALSGLERERLEDEYKELLEKINYYNGILADSGKLLGVIRGELSEIKRKYGDGRKSRIVPYDGELEIEDLISDEPAVITLSQFDYIKRMTINTYKTQNRGGRGVTAMATREEDAIKNIFVVQTHDDVLFITNTGRAYKLRAFEIPEASRAARGTAIVNLLNLNPGERVEAVIPISGYDGRLVMITKRGVIKKTTLSLFANVRRGGLIALNIREDDELIAALNAKDGDDVFIATREGLGIRFDEGRARDMGRQASGVRGIRLDGGDFVIGAEVVTPERKILIATEKGFGKTTEADEFRVTNRGGKGVKIYKTTDKTGKIVGIAGVAGGDELMLINSDGIIIRIRVDDIATTGRVAQGVKLINLPEGVHLVSVARIAEEQTEGGGRPEAEAEGAE